MTRTRGTPPQPGRSLQGWHAPDGIETHYDVRSRDSSLPVEEFRRLPRRPIHIVLDNLRSAFNVGSVFRLADAGLLAEVVTCGYTAHPPHHKLEQTSLGTDQSVPWRHVADTAEAVRDFRQRNILVVAVETVRGAPAYHRFDHRFPVALVFGNEARGVSPGVLAECDAAVQLPMAGYKNSVNVAAAAAVVVYELLGRGGWLELPDDA